MQIGLVDVYANHGVLVIGNRLEPDADLPLRGAAAVSSSHVLLATRGQAGLVRVRLWSGAGPRVGENVVAARLELASQHLFVFDLEKISVHSFDTGRSGDVPVRISVDDPGFASRVDILVGEEGSERDLPSVASHPLFPVTVGSDDELEVADELDLILSGHDLPLNRLAAAVKLISTAPAARPAIVDSRMDQVVEWSRWLTPQQSVGRSRELGRFLRRGIAGLREPVQDDEVLSLAETALAKTVFIR
ncbi:hypothetical protein ACQP26_25380 [Micromonospora sp. CA-248089]|uniref:hypothetical protein n=1 Tax=Micromonospora sp. CA-248089 TaxID=3239960 RepID=UPI003D90FFA8